VHNSLDIKIILITSDLVDSQRHFYLLSLIYYYTQNSRIVYHTQLIVQQINILHTK